MRNRIRYFQLYGKGGGVALEGRDRRGRIRVDYQGLAEVRVEGVRIEEVVLRDISAKGLFAVTEQKVELGKPCEVAIKLGSSEGLAVLVHGQVSRLGKDGFAITFDAIDPESYNHLRNIVLYNSREPDKVEEEFHKPGIK